MKYEFPIEHRDWQTGAGQPAGIWWLAGRTFLAGLGSLAEARLLEAGAFHVATLQFEPDAHDSRRPHATVHSLTHRAALQEFAAFE